MKNIEIDIEKIATLSMLNLSNDEKSEFKQDLEEIITFAEEISKSNTVNISKISDKTEIKNVFRTDEITNKTNRAELLKNAETNDGIYISVPKILGEK
ncbi:MAG: Asp-tRNA(Asn)/Glu-tRNA(Gln) amidotransferase subunit GatC [Clostridia bacterium]|nr:Asp-tRNA(Asn)/Glu-tRNA(Gln) amidotransferase subunit GatC [Clostridia bacterium]